MSCEHNFLGESLCEHCGETEHAYLLGRLVTVERDALERAAKFAGRWVSETFKDDVEALELEEAIRALLDAPEVKR